MLFLLFGRFLIGLTNKKKRSRIGEKMSENIISNLLNKENVMNKKIYTIDFTNIKYFWEIHEIIRKSLDFPDYYGCNWDAFWDCLTDMYGEPLHIIIIGLDIIEQKFDDAANKIISIFRRFKHYEKSFEKDILIEIVIDGVRKVLK